MVNRDLDADDLIFAPLFLLGSLYTTGLVSRTLGGWDPSTVLITVGGTAISYAGAASLAALLAVFFRRDEPLASLDGAFETWVVVVTFGLVVVGPFITPLQSVISQSTVAALIAVLIQVTGFTLVVYKN